MRSVNVFRSVSTGFPIRIEYWEDNYLRRVVEVREIDPEEAGMIVGFIQFRIKFDEQMEVIR